MASDSNPLKNRLIKNLKKIQSYKQKNNIEAYRIYHKDIPEYPYLIDIYKNKSVIYEQGKKIDSELEATRIEHQEEISQIITEIFSIPANSQFFKTREKQKGKEQYVPYNSRSLDFFIIEEGTLKFLVNLERYLDTGLFLDHRPLRKYLTENCQSQEVLNLFCYTGSLSVAAAIGGGKVTSVDLSNTYLDWAEENFKLNSLPLNQHHFVKANVLSYLQNAKISKIKFDKIILDPPSFSNSKSMESDLDIQRDHLFLIEKCMDLLNAEGQLYFSTNKKKFELHPEVNTKFSCKEISHWTIPQDFHHTHIHRSFMLEYKKN